MKRTNKKPLLARQTLRNLTPASMAGVRGGATMAVAVVASAAAAASAVAIMSVGYEEYSYDPNDVGGE